MEQEMSTADTTRLHPIRRGLTRAFRTSASASAIA